jgi:dihydrofolate reductase
MTQLILNLSVSLDGYIAGPDATLEEPLGRGGELLHEWAFKTAIFQEMHGGDGGERGDDDDAIRQWYGRQGAVVMGRRMFSGGEGPWEDDPNADGWWGDDPPFHVPVFILTHHPRKPVVKEGGTTYTFVTDGIESALEQARAAAEDRDVFIGGGANVAQQYLKTGLVDEIQLHLAPIFLGSGVRLFDGLDPSALEITSVVASPEVTHLAFRPAKGEMP